MLFGDRFLGASGHCPRNAAFMRQSGVRPNPCRINAAFRPKAALNLGAVPGCVPAFSARANSPAQSHPKPSQSHPEANAEGRMENAEGWGKADQSQPQARYKPSASQEHGMHPLVFLLCSSCAALVLLLFFRLAFGGAAVSPPRPCLILTDMVRPLFKRIRIFPSFAFPSTGLPEKALEFGAPAGSI